MAIRYLPISFWLNWVFQIFNWVFQVFLLGIHLKVNKQFQRALFLLTLRLFTFHLLSDNQLTILFSISETAISDLFRKLNVFIKSSMIQCGIQAKVR